MPTPDQRPLETRLRAVCRDLCGSLGDALEESLAHVDEALKEQLSRAQSRGRGRPYEHLRPVQLTTHLGLNKSLASRVVRALKEEEELRALSGIPTPQGLALIERAAREQGASASTLQRLRSATVAYAEVLGEFSGGRTDLEAALAGWIPEERERAERDARRSVFRGMTTLAGTRMGAAYNSLYLMPSRSDPHRLDSILVTVRQDLRRLRDRAAIPVMRITADAEHAHRQGRRETLDRAAIGSDPRSMLLPDLCSHPIPKLVMAGDARTVMAVQIAEDALDVNEFATLGFAWRTESHFARYDATGDEAHGRISIHAVRPTEAMVLDLFVHRDVELSGDPFASLLLESSLGASHPGPLPPASSRSRTLAPPVIALDKHPSGLHSQDVRACKAIAENACREAGLSVAAFTKYRTRVEFPLQEEKLTLWWPLPAGPS